MRFNTAKFILAIVWYIGGLFNMGILVYFQSIGHMNNIKQDYWGWFGINIMPMLTLITTTLIFSDNEKKLTKPVLFIFWISISISIIYLSLIGFLLWYSRYGGIDELGVTPYQFISETNFYLALIQSMYSVLLGYFFFKPKEDPA